jgi:hypothetical protein
MARMMEVHSPQMRQIKQMKTDYLRKSASSAASAGNVY